MRNRTFIHTMIGGVVLAFVLFIQAVPGLAQTPTQALSEINTFVAGFKDAVNLHTAAGDLDYTHLLPYFDANFKHDGAGPTELAAEFANGLRTGSISAGTVDSIVSLTTDANGNSKASTTGTFSATTVEGPFSQNWSPTAPDFADFAWFYKPAGGTWKLYGNQEPGKIKVKTFIENRQSGCQGCDGVSNFVWFDVRAPQGSVASVTVTGPGFDATPLVNTGTQTKQEQASPPPATPMSFSYETFQFYGPAVSSLPPPGSVYTFTMTPASGAPILVTRIVPQTTSETIAITSPTGHALADAHLGGALTLNWTLPTFPVQSVDTYMVTNSAAGMCHGPQPDNSLPPNATSYTFSPVPTQCLGQPIADNVSQGYPVQVVVDVTGVNGENTRAWHSFGSVTCNGNLPPGSLSGSQVAANLVQLQWSKACLPTTIANYEVWRSTAPSGPFTKVGMTDQNTRNYSDNTVSIGVTYYYYVTANDTGGNHTAPSNQITVATTGGGGTDTTAPTVPTGVNAVAVGPNQVDVSWTSSTDNVGVAYYQVYRNGVAAGAPAGANNTFWPDYQASPGNTYTYTLSACDAAGNCSAQSSAVSATTPAGSGVNQFDGTYSGTWSVICPACGDTAAGTVTIPVTNGVLSNVTGTITSGTHGILFTSGTVSSSGAITGAGVAPPQCSGSVSTFTGQIALSGSTDLVMTMDYSRPASDTCAAESGTMTATRATGGTAPSSTTTSTTTTTTGSTTTTTQGGAGGSVTLNFVAGWNLVGNSIDAILDVATAFADKTNVSTVWKWVASKSSWAFYTPTLADGGAAYASGKGYDFLSSINGGEGFWVNAKNSFSAQLPSGSAMNSAAFQSMAPGWNLIAVGDNKTPSEFNKALNLTPPSVGDIPLNITTLWAWDGAQSNWYFYAPSLEKNGGLSAYIQSKSYLDFGTKKLEPAMGFWVNKPQ